MSEALLGLYFINQCSPIFEVFDPDSPSSNTRLSHSTPIPTHSPHDLEPMFYPHEPGPDHTPETWTNESTPLLWGSIVYGTPQCVRFSDRPRYTRPSQLHDIEEREVSVDDDGRWKRWMRRGLVGVVVLGGFAVTIWAGVVFGLPLDSGP